MKVIFHNIASILKYNLPLCSPPFLQPTEFVQLDHEKQFKLVLGGLFAATFVYVSAACALSHIVKAGKIIFIGPESDHWLCLSLTP